MALTISGSAYHFQALVCQDDGNAIPNALVGCIMAHSMSARSLLCCSHGAPQSKAAKLFQGADLLSRLQQCLASTSAWLVPQMACQSVP